MNNLGAIHFFLFYFYAVQLSNLHRQAEMNSFPLNTKGLWISVVGLLKKIFVYQKTKTALNILSFVCFSLKFV